MEPLRGQLSGIHLCHGARFFLIRLVGHSGHSGETLGSCLTTVSQAQVMEMQMAGSREGSFREEHVLAEAFYCHASIAMSVA